jgi:sorbitol-specific phosphotransferase system component IIBC
MADKEVKFNKAEKTEVRRRVAERTKAKLLKFHGEVRKSVLTAIVAAFSFLIALSWKELIGEWVGMINSISPVHSKIFEVSIITIVCVLGILIATRFLGEKK